MNIKTGVFVILSFVGSVLASSAHADYARIEQDHPSVSYTGNWHTVNSPYVSGGSVAYASEAGATTSITFTGTGIQWRSWKCENVAGSARVYMDGVLKTTAEIYWGARVGQCETAYMYGISGLPHGTHVLTLEVTGLGTSYPNTNVVVDAFYVETGIVTQLLEENDPAITYTGTWMDIDDPSVSGGSVVASREAGATATVRWRGQRFAWISYRCPCASGSVRLYKDGVNFHTLYPYSTEREAQAEFFSLPGDNVTEQEFKIEVTGENGVGENPWVVIDAFRILQSTDGADTTPPEIALRIPAQGATVHGQQPLIVDTFDNRFATTVRYFVDGIEFTANATPPPEGGSRVGYLWDTSNVSDGPHVLTAVARDAAGNDTSSAPINVIVDNASDWTPPEVTLTAPAHNSTVTGVVTLSAIATDNVGVVRVAFYTVQGDFIGEDMTAPYSITRDTSGIPSGKTFFLEARAYDAAGNYWGSGGNVVTVQH